MTLVDTRYYGAALRGAQKRNCLSNEQIAKILKVKKSDWRCYSRGSQLIPENVLQKILESGLALLKFKHNDYKN